MSYYKKYPINYVPKQSDTKIHNSNIIASLIEGFNF